MNDGRYNYFSLNGPNLMMNKPRYRENEYTKKNTYNFVTDPRLKRGRNYGIVYVTSTAFDENDLGMKKLNNELTSGAGLSNENNFSDSSTRPKKKQKKLKNEENLEQMGVPLPDNLENVGCMTTEIKEILPTPETYDMEVQTQDYIDLPQIPLFKPEKRGEDAGTQIEKGELFDFDEEVEPIINVLTFKTLEEARMEVLEEEEIKEMKRQMQEFEKVRNRELEIVQKFETRAVRKEEEKKRRNEERLIRTQMAQTYQKKLISRVFAKNCLKDLKTLSLKNLEDNGVLRKKEKNEYHTKIVPQMREQCESLLEEENNVLYGLDDLLENCYNDTILNQHKVSLENEKKRKDEEKRKKIEELRKQKEEKIRRRLERQRKKHEKEMEQLKTQIKEDLISKGEYVDSCSDIYNMNYYGQKEFKGVPTVLGHSGQIAIILSLLKNTFNKIFTMPEQEEVKQEEKKEGEEVKEPENIKKEKIPEKDKKAPEGSPPQEPPSTEPLFLDFNETAKKLVDLYLLKCAPFYFLITNEILDKIKAIDQNIASIDDIWKIEDKQVFSDIINIIIESNLSLDNTFKVVVDTFNQDLQIGDFNDILINTLTNIFMLSKTATEFDVRDKIRFIQIENNKIDDNKYFGICDIQQSFVPKAKTSNELAAQLLAKKNMGKKDAKGRPFFEPLIGEKVYIFPIISDKMRILAMNSNYDKIFRTNLLNCLKTLEIKFAKEGDNLYNNMNESYNSFVQSFKKRLEANYKQDVLNIVVEPPTDG